MEWGKKQYPLPLRTTPLSKRRNGSGERDVSGLFKGPIHACGAFFLILPE